MGQENPLKGTPRGETGQGMQKERRNEGGKLRGILE